MRIALDIRPALNRGSGVGTFVEGLALALDRSEGDHSIRLFSSSARDRWNLDRWPNLSRSEICDRRWPVRLLNLLWHRVERPHIETLVGPVDVVHSPTPLLIPSRAAQVTTLHDLYFISHPEHTHREIRRDYARLVAEHCRRADLIVAVSHATRDAAIQHLGIPPTKIQVCYQDVSPFFDDQPSATDLAQIDGLIPNPFFVFIGTIEPRKNLGSLIRAFNRLASQHPDPVLVIAGSPGWDTGDFDRAVGELDDKNRVVLCGYRNRAFIRALYHRAVSLVMPSYCEGFGLPLVEAMACGCPIIAAHNSAMPEVAGSAALYWQGRNPDALADLMGRMLLDSSLRDDLKRQGAIQRQRYDWTASAQQLLATYAELVAK